MLLASDPGALVTARYTFSRRSQQRMQLSLNGEHIHGSIGCCMCSLAMTLAFAPLAFVSTTDRPATLDSPTFLSQRRALFHSPIGLHTSPRPKNSSRLPHGILLPEIDPRSFFHLPTRTPQFHGVVRYVFHLGTTYARLLQNV